MSNYLKGKVVVVTGAAGPTLSAAQMDVVKLVSPRRLRCSQAPPCATDPSPAVVACRAQLPLYALVSFGCYSLASISMSLLAVRDCPEASDELNQVRDAKLLRMARARSLAY